MNLKNECKNELTKRIIPFWNALRDDENGGFYGFMNNKLKVDKKADKGVILNSRILWFYSSAYKALGEQELLDNAEHAYKFLKNRCYDKKYGGVYYMMTFDGKASDAMKHTYNQAFAIYALSAYYMASGDKEALALAYELFNTIETKCVDEYGYVEAFSRTWKPAKNDVLSENGIDASKTMNNVLHLIEAYTVLLKADGNEKVRKRLMYLLGITKNKIFDKENNKLLVFFDNKMNVLGDIHSYGHDIEASWLIDRACEVIADREVEAEWRNIDLRIAENIYNIAFVDGALNNERDGKKIDGKRVWWVQAETVVGFTNAYMQSGDKKYLKAAEETMNWIKTYQVDPRENSEWWGEVDHKGKPMKTVEMVNPWKCPYHNGRMCLEIMDRDF
ncbi:MAG: AGE family epimerase/isomerase [Oscillospiraceae bacterium]